MQAATSVLTRPVSRKTAHLLFAVLFAGMALFYGYMYLTRRPPASTVGVVLPGRAGVPVFDRFIYGGFGDLQLDKPMAVTAAQGRIYISDTNNARVQVFNNAGEFLFTFGERGRAPGQFLYPYGIAADRNGNIYVAEMYLSRIQVYDADGNYQRDFAPELTQNRMLQGPADLAISGNTLYVTDVRLNRVLLIDIETGRLLNIVGLRLDLLAPNGIAVDESGFMYVVDTGRQRVVVYNPEGNPVRVINGTPTGHGRASVLINPRGIGVDRSGNIYVASNLSHTVYVFDREGRQVHSFGGHGDGIGQFAFPNGLHLDGAGRLFVTDTSNQRVAVYRLARQ